MSATYAMVPWVALLFFKASRSALLPLLAPLTAALKPLMMGGTICCSGLGTVGGSTFSPLAKPRTWPLLLLCGEKNEEGGVSEGHGGG